MSHIYLSATHKSSGKTLLSVGICAALTEDGLAVQPFKKGPDYIDPIWLTSAAHRSCMNLDFYTMEHPEIQREFATAMKGADIGVIEGNKGLYDGLDIEGKDSNAALSKQLGSPVVLVIDSRGMTRGVVPLLLGYQSFDPEVTISGVILNQVGGSRHEQKLRSAIQHYTDLPVVGALRGDRSLSIEERHLGLVPYNETSQAQSMIERLGRTVAQQVDLSRLKEIAATALVPKVDLSSVSFHRGSSVKIGYPKDRAFGFYYPGDLQAMEAQGAELIPFDALNDPHLPAVDGLFIGGGFPETSMQELSANQSMRASIFQFIEQGGPVYAECGGLIYLSRSIEWKEVRCEMVGTIPADALMHTKPIGRGYVRLRKTAQHPWPVDSDQTEELAAHEFHYSSLQGPDEKLGFAYEVLRGEGVDGRHDGLIYKNLLATYSHQRHTDTNPWTGRFLAFVRQVKQDNQGRTV